MKNGFLFIQKWFCQSPNKNGSVSLQKGKTHQVQSHHALYSHASHQKMLKQYDQIMTVFIMLLIIFFFLEF